MSLVEQDWPSGAPNMERKAALWLLLAVLGLVVFFALPKVMARYFRTVCTIVDTDFQQIAWDATYEAEALGEALPVALEEFHQWHTMCFGECIPKDPWGRDYLFDLWPSGKGFTIQTLGKDGVRGGGDDEQARFGYSPVYGLEYLYEEKGGVALCAEPTEVLCVLGLARARALSGR